MANHEREDEILNRPNLRVISVQLPMSWRMVFGSSFEIVAGVARRFQHMIEPHTVDCCEREASIYLTELGYEVLRIPGYDVLRETESVRSDCGGD